jgi:hypothetical protein
MFAKKGLSHKRQPHELLAINTVKTDYKRVISHEQNSLV